MGNELPYYEQEGEVRNADRIWASTPQNLASGEITPLTPLVRGELVISGQLSVFLSLILRRRLIDDIKQNGIFLSKFCGAFGTRLRCAVYGW